MPVVVTYNYVILVRLLYLLILQLLFGKWECVLRTMHISQVCFEATVIKYVRFLEQCWEPWKCCRTAVTPNAFSSMSAE